MRFLAPWALSGLVVVPMLVAGYVLALRRRGRTRPPGFELVDRTTAKPVPSARRHVPFALFALAITVALIGFARPELNIALPTRTGTVILAIDTSNSMTALDVEPSRIAAAKAAATAMVEARPGSIRLGVVGFTSGGLVLVEPTDSRTDVLAAIDRLTTSGSTSVGEGIFAGLDAIALRPIEIDPDADAAEVAALDIGYFSNAVIVLFTDGEQRQGADPLALADLASNAGVRIFPVGFGKVEGILLELDGFTVSTALDEALLIEIAAVTDGVYYAGADSPALAEIYDGVDRRFERRGETIEATALFAMASMALLIVAGALSFRWFGRVA